MMQAEPPTATPSQRLAEEIISALRKDGLIQPSDVAKLQVGLSTGTFTQDDWLSLARHTTGTLQGEG